MSKNIVLLSDGTGNSSSKVFRTNVWRFVRGARPERSRPAKSPITTMASERPRSSRWRSSAVSSARAEAQCHRHLFVLLPQLRRWRQALRVSASAAAPLPSAWLPVFIARVGLIRYDGDEAHLARDAEIAIANTARSGTSSPAPMS